MALQPDDEFLALRMQATMTVLPCVVRYARALIRAINEGYTGGVSRNEETFLVQCQLLATAFVTIKDGMRVLLDAQHTPRSASGAASQCSGALVFGTATSNHEFLSLACLILHTVPAR